jgi:hypothetical protein
MNTTLFISNDQVLAELERHVGKDNGIHVRDLVARITGLAVNPVSHERRVRKAIEELRRKGQRICGLPDAGYFLAASEAELLETCSHLRRRAISGLVTESRMRNVSLPELVGQIDFVNESNS